MVRLASETFNYSPIDRAKSKTKQFTMQKFEVIGKKFHRLGLPPKVSYISSCNLFLNIRGLYPGSYFLKITEVEILEVPFNL